MISCQTPNNGEVLTTHSTKIYDFLEPQQVCWDYWDCQARSKTHWINWLRRVLKTNIKHTFEWIHCNDSRMILSLSYWPFSENIVSSILNNYWFTSWLRGIKSCPTNWSTCLYPKVFTRILISSLPVFMALILWIKIFFIFQKTLEGQLIWYVAAPWQVGCSCEIERASNFIFASVC